MCGLFGWSFSGSKGVGPAQREALASVLALGNAARGDDAYGAYLLRGGGRSEIIRRVGDITNAPGVAAWGRMRVVMAHTRQATHGAVVEKNCHPFVAGPITLAHNGVIANHSDLNRTHGRTCDVDSEHLALHMAEGKPFSEIQGYGAISWVNQAEPSTVNLCRMRNGSLKVYGVTLGEGRQSPQIATVWSSDERHLRRALEAAYMFAFPYEPLAEGRVYEVKAGKLWETDARFNVSAPAWIDSRVVRLTQGVKSDDGDSYDVDAMLRRWAKGDPTIERHVSEIVNDDRPASWADRRNRLARDLELTAVTSRTWIDSKGKVVTSEELDDLMEAELE